MTTVTMTYGQVVEFYNVLKNELKGRESPEHDKDGKFVGMTLKPFDFELKTSIAFAKTLRKMRGIIDDIEAAQQLIVSRCQDRADPIDVAKTNEEVRAFLRDNNEEIEVHLIAEESVKVATNKLDPWVYSNLCWMIKEEQEDIEAERKANLARRSKSKTEPLQDSEPK